MSRLNDAEIKTILRIKNKKRELTKVIDDAINELTYVRSSKRLWWREMVDKYKLNKNKMHRIWIDGSILEERRHDDNRKIF